MDAASGAIAGGSNPPCQLPVACLLCHVVAPRPGAEIAAPGPPSPERGGERQQGCVGSGLHVADVGVGLVRAEHRGQAVQVGGFVGEEGAALGKQLCAHGPQR